MERSKKRKGADFRDLDVWKLARELKKEIQLLCKKLPVEEKYRLADQLVRASRSVTANIAEGYGRYHYQETIQFCRQARGSLYECLDHLTVCLDCGYIGHKQFKYFEAKISYILVKLNAYINYLKDRKQSSANLTIQPFNHLTI